MSATGSRKKISKKLIRLIPVIAGFLILLGAAGYTVFLAPLLKKDQWVYKEYAVQKGTLAVGVTESGSLELGITQIAYDLDLETKSDDDEDDEEEETERYLKVEEVYVSAGQSVKEGDALIKLSSESIQAVRRNLESALVEAKTDYNEAQGDYELASLEANLDYESALIDSKYAKSIYQNGIKDLDGDVTALKLELEQCKAETSSLEEKLAEAQEGYGELEKKYQDAKALWESIPVSDTTNFLIFEKEYRNAQTAYQNATDQIKQAKKAIESNAKQISQLTRKINTTSKSSKLERLEIDETYQESVLNGENAQVTYDSTIEGLKEDLLEAQNDLDEANERLEKFEAFVGEDGVIYADADGMITEVACEAGQTLERSQNLISYAKPTDMTISVDVTQEDIVSLQVGDKVNITFTAYEETPYTGVIRSIETTATSRNTDTVSYSVVVAVEGDTKGLYGGMTSDIVFVLEEKEDVIYVSKKAVFEENAKSYVYTKNKTGEMEKKEVTIGLTNGVNTEIVQGLEEGDVIYLASKVSSETEVTNAASDDGGQKSGANGFGSGQTDGMPDFGSIPDMGNMPDMGSMPDMSNMPGGGFTPGQGGNGSSGGRPGGKGSGDRSDRPAGQGGR